MSERQVLFKCGLCVPGCGGKDEKKKEIKKKIVQRQLFEVETKWPRSKTITISFIKTGKETPLSLEKEKNGDPLYYTIHGKDPKAIIKTVIEQRIFPICGLDLRWVADNDSKADIKIAYGLEPGSWAYVGSQSYDGEEYTMHLGWLDISTILHEFMHVLGFLHEHQHPDRHFELDEDAVKEYFTKPLALGGFYEWTITQVNTNILNVYSGPTGGISEYDAQSIMLYNLESFLIKDSEVGIEPAKKMSHGDIKAIATRYPGGAMSVCNMYKKIWGTEPPDEMCLIEEEEEEEEEKQEEEGEEEEKQEEEEENKKKNTWLNYLFIFGSLIAIVILIIFFQKGLRRSEILNRGREGTTVDGQTRA